MAVTEVGTPTSGNSGSATDTSFTTTFPATPQAGDWAVIVAHLSGNSLTMSIDSSFAAITGWSNPYTQGTASRTYAWAKELSAGEAAPTITNSGSVTGGWECHLFRGASGVRGSRSGTSGTSISLPTLTGCAAGSKLLAAVHARVASGTIPSGITPDAAYTEAIDHATSRSTGSANVRMQTCTRDVATAGDYGGESFSVTNSISSSLAAGLIEVLADATASEVTLTPATMTVEAVVVTPVPQPVTVALTPATVTLAAVAVTPVPGAVTVALTPAVAALAAVALVPVPGAVTVALTPAVLALAAQPMSPSSGAAEVTLTPAVVTLAAVAVTPVPQPVTVALTPASVQLAAVAVGPVPQPVTVTLAAAVLVVQAQPLGPVPGPVAVTLTPVVLQLAAVALAAAAVGGVVVRPNTGTTTRPSTGTIARPYTGTVTRP